MRFSMAHQAHNIPWALLSSNLRWVAGSCHCGACDFHPRFKANQGKDLTHFAKAFARNVEEHSICDRRKYPEKYDPPSSTTVVVDGKTAAKISPTVRRWRSHRELGCGGKSCQYERGSNCQCPVLPDEERTVSAFCRQHQYAQSYQSLRQRKAGLFNLELVKTLILYGDIGPILRACTHPDVAIRSWWEVDEFCCGVSHEDIRQSALFRYPMVHISILGPVLTLLGFRPRMGSSLQESINGIYLPECDTVLSRVMG